MVEERWMEAVGESVLLETIGIERLYGLADYPEIGWWMVDSVIATLKDLRPAFGGRIPRWEAQKLTTNALATPTEPAWNLNLLLFGDGIHHAIVDISNLSYELHISAPERIPIIAHGQVQGYTTHP
jgi:hypothetical protein